jgi:cbb3-type cytochrome oxidase subunit 3
MELKTILTIVLVLFILGAGTWLYFRNKRKK